MKKKYILFFISNIIILIVFLMLILNSSKGFAQTSFFATTGTNAALKESGSTIPFPIASTNQWDAYRWVKFYVNVSLGQNLASGTLELIQVNIDYADASQSFYTSTTTDIYLKSPNGSEYKILDGGTVLYKDVNVRLRDHSQLNRACQKSSPVPYAVGYYRTETSGTFDNFIGEDPDGDWEIRFDNNSTRTRPIITNVELVFGVLTEENILSSTANDACATPQWFCQDSEVIYQNVGHSGDNSVDPPCSSIACTPQNLCAWNNNLDNTSWFAFNATQTTAVVTISGMSGADHQQFIVVGNSSGSNSCSQSDLYTLTGGCPTDAANNYNSLYNNGTYYNMEFNLSGLTVGDTYYLITDGDGGAQSPAYLTVDGASDCTVLPIELIDFNGTNNNGINELYWSTASEINNNYFTIERSMDARNWETIKFIDGAGNSNTTLIYSYYDDSYYYETSYYRLKQTDYDGKYTYSKTISISSDNKNNINIFPNPAKDFITITGTTENVLMDIYSSDGIKIKSIKAGDNSTSINVNNFPNGIYILTFINNNGEMSSHKFHVIK